MLTAVDLLRAARTHSTLEDLEDAFPQEQARAVLAVLDACVEHRCLAFTVEGYQFTRRGRGLLR